MPGEKRCTKCGEVKPLDAFNRDRQRLRSECKGCYATRQSAHYAANRTKVRESQAAYREANRYRVIAQKRASYYANAEALAAYRAANSARRVRATTAWRAANPGKAAAACARYVAAKLRATPAWASPDLVAAFYVLAEVWGKATGVPHHVDHIEPLRGKHVCGLHNEFNLQVLPAKLNHTKSNRQVDIRASACMGPVVPQGQGIWR